MKFNTGAQKTIQSKLTLYIKGFLLVGRVCWISADNDAIQRINI